MNTHRNLRTGLARAAGDHLLAANDETARCPQCDGTGDVHRADGAYIGRCACGAGDLTAEDLAAIDAQFDPEAEQRAVEADLHINAMKDSGEWSRRRLERGWGL